MARIALLFERHRRLALIGLAGMILVSSYCVFGKSSTKGETSTAKAGKAEVCPTGRPVTIKINSPIDVSFPGFPREFACVVSLLNDSMVNPRAYVDGGEPHILFDLDYEKWPWKASPFPGNGA